MLATVRHGEFVPFTRGHSKTDSGSFAYFFPDAPGLSYGPTTLADFDALHAKMADQPRPAQMDNSGLPPIMTYMGQFIDHDCVAAAQLDAPGGGAAPGIYPRPRDQITAELVNLRRGNLDLDSLYGPKQATGDVALDKLLGLLRYPKDRAMMWIAPFSHDPQANGPRFPEDRAGDLLRLGRLLEAARGEDAPHLTPEDLAALPPAQRALFEGACPGVLNRHRAIIADPRNDEHLLLAQLHLAFLRFHNRMVQAYPLARKTGDADDVHAWAREQVTLHYQWLILNVYLPAICDAATYRDILHRQCAMYGALLARQGGGPQGQLPMPVEFSFAAFRFGHSMVRGSYDWNALHGRGEGNQQSFAQSQDLFAYSGHATVPMPTGDGGSFDRLPDSWAPDWDRLVHDASAYADRSARPIDTRLSIPTAGLDLRRGMEMDLPVAQACIDDIERNTGVEMRRLTRAQLSSGSTGSVMRSAGFDVETPLWFYVLKEAEVLGCGQHLGPLGTHVVAGTIAGLIVHDPSSCWNRRGSAEGRWHPVDGARASGQLVDSFPALIRAAGLM